jgi:hypothetical protein
MFRLDYDDAALLAILDDPFLDDAMSMDPFVVRIIQQVKSIRPTFLYYQETGIPLETSFHESLRLDADIPAPYTGREFGLKRPSLWTGR